MFDPITHSAQFIDVKGEPTKERQNLSLVFNEAHAQHQTIEMQPGPLRLTLDNRTTRRVLPAVWVAGDKLHAMLGRRRPFLTANRLLSNQTFRDLYRTDTLDIDQRLKITSLTFLFTDLKGSTQLYERVGDLAAYDLVKEHFRVLHDIVGSEAGAVVKTIGDAVMATFPTPDHAVAAALRMREAMRKLNDGAWSRRSAAQDRHSRGPVPRGDAQRSAGLFRPDGEHRVARAEPCHIARHLRDRGGGGRSADLQVNGKPRPPSDPEAHGLAGHAGRVLGLRDSVEHRQNSERALEPNFHRVGDVAQWTLAVDLIVAEPLIHPVRRAEARVRPEEEMRAHLSDARSSPHAATSLLPSPRRRWSGRT